MTPRSRALVGAVAAVLALALSACGSSSTPTDSTRGTSDEAVQAVPSDQVTTTPAADAKVITVTITADSVDPAGAQVDLKRDQPVVLKINAAAAGELHVHSTPGQEVAFPAGDSQVTLTFDKPGLVDMEDHTLNKLIVQFQVS